MVFDSEELLPNPLFATPMYAQYSHEGTVCGEQQLLVSTQWTEITFDLAAGCASAPVLSSVTLSHGGDAVPLLLDDILFE